MGPCLLGLRKQYTCITFPKNLSPFGPRTVELCLKVCLSMFERFPVKHVSSLVALGPHKPRLSSFPIHSLRDFLFRAIGCHPPCPVTDSRYDRQRERKPSKYVRKVNHVRRTIVISMISQYPRCLPSLYDYASRP